MPGSVPGLDEETRAKLEHGRRVREILKQDRFSPLTAGQQAAVLLAVTQGLFDTLDARRVLEVEAELLAKLEASRGSLDFLARAHPDDSVWNDLSREIKTHLGAMR